MSSWYITFSAPSTISALTRTSNAVTVIRVESWFSVVQWARTTSYNRVGYFLSPDNWQGYHQRESSHIYQLVSDWSDKQESILNKIPSMSVTLVSRLVLHLHKSTDNAIWSTAIRNDSSSPNAFTTRLDVEFSSHNFQADSGWLDPVPGCEISSLLVSVL